MTVTDAPPEDAHIASDLPPAVEAIIGVKWLHWCLEEAMDNWDADFDHDLTRTECRLLVALDRPKRMGFLAEELAMLPSSLTALADSACEKGVATRRRDPQDRRAWLLEANAAGLSLRAEMLSFAAEEFARLTGLDDMEITDLARLMNKARAVIHARDKSKGPIL